MDRNQVTEALNILAGQYNGMILPGGDTLVMFIREGEGMSLEFSFDILGNLQQSCTTNYKAQGRDFTFDRRGFDASFYVESIADLEREVPQQITRVKEAQERLAASKEFNLGPAKRFFTQDALNKIIIDLKAGKQYCYNPGHMGTGYVFSISPSIRNRFDRATASPELVKLVGRQVYVSSFDAD